MSRRREPRVEMNIDVTVWGMDRYGKAFVQHARTLNTTRSGARLLGVDCVREGETVGIQHGEKKSRFRVVWVGRQDSSRAGQVGVHCLEDKPVFLPERASRGIEFDLGNVGGYATALESARRRPKDGLPSRRKYPRYHCTGSVELRRPEGGHPIWANLSDLCLTGCYVETVSTLPSGSHVLFQVRFQDLAVRGRAVVKTSHHAVGMGLSFQHLSPEDQQHLEFMVGSLESSKDVVHAEEKLAPQTAQLSLPPVQPGPVLHPASVQPVNVQPEVQPAAVQPVRAATVTPTAAPAPAHAMAKAQPPKKDSGVFSQMTRALAELSELEHLLVQDNTDSKIDARLIGQFHDAVEHTRQTAWNVQRFLDLHGSGSDPFAVVPQVEAERIRMFVRLARNVTADLDSSGIESGQNIAQLYQTVQQLERRLATMMKLKPQNGTPARS
jgi:hypothetical protein